MSFISFQSQPILIELLFKLDFPKFINDREAIASFCTCKTSYYRNYPLYKLKGGYTIAVLSEFLLDDSKKLGTFGGNVQGKAFNPVFVRCKDCLFLKEQRILWASLLAEMLEINQNITSVNLYESKIGFTGALAI